MTQRIFTILNLFADVLSCDAVFEPAIDPTVSASSTVNSTIYSDADFVIQPSPDPTNSVLSEQGSRTSVLSLLRRLPHLVEDVLHDSLVRGEFCSGRDIQLLCFLTVDYSMCAESHVGPEKQLTYEVLWISCPRSVRMFKTA